MIKTKSDINKHVGSLIRKLRVEHGLSGKELGDMIGISQQQISRYERAKSDISLNTLVKIAAGFNYTLLQFIIEMDAIALNETQDNKFIFERKNTFELF
ncbi:TPA: helix-turn-helix domain-containing protein [Proteus mirabilis]|nr:helix-turn-helix transcriptional regulator [Proteus mirabilis]